MEIATQVDIQQTVLAYLFTCVLTDDTVINQAPDNKPTLSEIGSAFTDVQNRIDEVAFFNLKSLDDNEEYGVDLITGLFYINGKEVKLCDPSIKIPDDAKFRLIYFRRNRLHFTGDVQSKDPVEYFIGWQTNDVDGKNIQQTLSFI